MASDGGRVGGVHGHGQGEAVRDLPRRARRIPLPLLQGEAFHDHVAQLHGPQAVVVLDEGALGQAPVGLARDPRPAGTGAEDGDAADQLHGPAVDAGGQLHGVAVADGVQGLLDGTEGMPGAAVAPGWRVVVHVKPRAPVLERRGHLHRASGCDLHLAPVGPVPPRSGGHGVAPRGQPVPRQASVAGLVRQHQRASAPQLEAGAGHGCARGEDPHVQGPQVGLRQDQAAQVLGQVLGAAAVPGDPGRGVPRLVAVDGDHVRSSPTLPT